MHIEPGFVSSDKVMGRQHEEVAALALLLASDECQYMTGAELHIDAGIMAGSVALRDKK